MPTHAGRVLCLNYTVKPPTCDSYQMIFETLCRFYDFVYPHQVYLLFYLIILRQGLCNPSWACIHCLAAKSDLELLNPLVLPPEHWDQHAWFIMALGTKSKALCMKATSRPTVPLLSSPLTRVSLKEEPHNCLAGSLHTTS